MKNFKLLIIPLTLFSLLLLADNSAAGSQSLMGNDDYKGVCKQKVNSNDMACVITSGQKNCDKDSDCTIGIAIQ
jgi:hypothetical protein